MRGSAGKVAGSALSVFVVAVSVVAASAGLIASTQPAGARTPPTVPGAPKEVVASPGPVEAIVDWVKPSDGGAAVTQYKISAKDLTLPARGGQTTLASGYSVGQVVRGLTAGDRYTFKVTAANSVGTGPASAASNAVVPTPAPPPGGISCEHALGTTGGVVAVSSCHLGGTGNLPGATLKGTRTGKITWTQGAQSYSTTIAITTTLIPDSESSGYCAKQGLGGAYHVHGKVTADTNPRTAVGASVSAYLCITESGAVRQAHYGYFDF
jgi:Fibronectin type III domain